MTTTTESSTRVHQIQEELNKGHQLAPFPDSVTKLLEKLKDENSDLKQIETVITTDPGLSTRILRHANSPLFGANQEIQQVSQAVMMLGRNKLKSLALTFAGANLFQGATKKELWNHSIGCAVTSREIALLKGLDADLAFVSGIFHDVGKLFFWDIFPEQYQELTNRYRGGEALSNAEKTGFGICHGEVGQKLAIDWPLPREIKQVIRCHHLKSDDQLATVVRLADSIAHFFGIGSEPDRAVEIPVGSSETLGLGSEQIAGVLEKSQVAFDDMASGN